MIRFLICIVTILRGPLLEWCGYTTNCQRKRNAKKDERKAKEEEHKAKEEERKAKEARRTAIAPESADGEMGIRTIVPMPGVRLRCTVDT